MWSQLVKIVESLESGALKKIMTGAGVMFTSNFIFMNAFSAGVAQLQASTQSASADVLALAHMAGFDTSMSIILSSIVTRLTLNSSKLFLKKK